VFCVLYLETHISSHLGHGSSGGAHKSLDITGISSSHRARMVSCASIGDHDGGLYGSWLVFEPVRS
jgi:hypothetical protein